MSRHINFRNHIDPVRGRHLLEIPEFRLRIRAILCCQSRITFTFQTESRIRLVPVIPKELHKPIVIQMHLKFIQFIKRKNLHIITQIIHRKELAGHVNHESPVRIQGKIRGLPFHQSFRLIVNHLQQGACSPENPFRSRRFNRHFASDSHPVTFVTQGLVRFAQGQKYRSFSFFPVTTR